MQDGMSTIAIVGPGVDWIGKLGMDFLSNIGLDNQIDIIIFGLNVLCEVDQGLSDGRRILLLCEEDIARGSRPLEAEKIIIFSF